LTFYHSEEVYQFKITDLEVANVSLQEWAKTSGQTLRKFYKLQEGLTVVRIPKSNLRSDYVQNIDIPSMTQPLFVDEEGKNDKDVDVEAELGAIDR